MPNSRQTSVIASPSRSRPTNCRRSSMTEHSFHGINTSRSKAKSVTHVSGTICHLCLRPLSRFSIASRHHGDCSHPGSCLGTVLVAIGVDPGLNLDLALGQIDVAPTQRMQLAGANAGPAR